MELIPILSFIILVSTISTFILAIGAYVLYKLRERKGRPQQALSHASAPAEMEAELYMPLSRTGEYVLDAPAYQERYTGGGMPQEARYTQERGATQERTFRRFTGELNPGARPYYQPQQRVTGQPEPRFVTAQPTGRPQRASEPNQAPQQYPGQRPFTGQQQQYPGRPQQMPMGPRDDDGAERNDGRKFMKYTSEGYVPVNDNKNGENLKWR